MGEKPNFEESPQIPREHVDASGFPEEPAVPDTAQEPASNEAIDTDGETGRTTEEVAQAAGSIATTKEHKRIAPQGFDIDDENDPENRWSNM